MEKQSYSPMSLLTILPDGKVENDARITDKAVTGVCTVYMRRSDSENEFLLREVGVALIDGSCNLTDAVRTAVDQAYNAAMSRIVGVGLDSGSVAQAPVKANLTVAQAIQVPAAKPVPPDVNTTGEEKKTSAEATPVAQINELSSGAAATEPSRPPIDLSGVLNAPSKPTADNTPPISGSSAGGSEAIDGIERIEFADNPPHVPETLDSGVIKVGMDDGSGVDPEYQNALDTVITIFGKLHDCNNWKAGKILSERPGVIVDFCQRNSEGFTGPKYTGPRTDQKDALLKLYPDALRKLDKAA